VQPLRVLVVGHGLVGRRRASALAELAGRLPVALAAIVDPVSRPDGALGDVRHYAGLDDVPSDAYDAAVIAVPHDVAPALATKVLASGKPILGEKPLAATARQVMELGQLAATLPKPSFVGYNYRFLPTVRELFERHAAGSLGPLRNIDLLVGHGGHRGSAEGWKLSPERAGGGVLLDPGVHLLDLLLGLAPGVRFSHVAATRGFWKTGIEEDLVAVFEHEQLLATVRVSHIRWVNTFRIEVYGDDGYAVIEGRGGNYGPQRIRIGRRWAWSEGEGLSQRETEEVHDFGLDDPSFADELEAVVLRWVGEPPAATVLAPATLDEALGVMELCEELYERLGGRDGPGVSSGGR
jgi:1,5-anhydro-D-fructose reductase (1,5-anhydro-D-mannitol-forming)